MWRFKNTSHPSPSEYAKADRLIAPLTALEPVRGQCAQAINLDGVFPFVKASIEITIRIRSAQQYFLASKHAHTLSPRALWAHAALASGVGLSITL